MEAELIAWLRETLPTSPLLKLGLGDDAAVLATAGRGDVVITTDLLCDGVDFDLRTQHACAIGHKALAVNLSDLAAMAARPLAAVISLNLPRNFEIATLPPSPLHPFTPSPVHPPVTNSPLKLAQQLYLGLLPLAEKHRVVIAGGDTNTSDGPLVISITALGEVTRDGPLTRRGANPGDRIVVTGAFGGSILGRHLAVQPRVDEALLLKRQYKLHAGIDCSDGLSLDLWRLCQASGCGAVIDAASVPIAEAAWELVRGDAATARHPSPPIAMGGLSAEYRRSLTHALADGEDFELILAVPPREAQRMLAEQPLEGVPLTEIGEFTAAKKLTIRDEHGNASPLEPRGFVHK